MTMNYDRVEGLAQALFEASGDAQFLLDPESDQLLDANSAAQRLTGLSLCELLGKTLDQLVRFGGAGGLRQLRQAAAKSGTFHAQEGYALCSSQLEVFTPVNLTVSRLHVKRGTLALISARDVRDQRGLSARLERAEGDLARVLASVPDCLWTAELDAAGQWTYRYVSPAVEGITGEPPDFFLPGVHRWWGKVHPEDQPRWEQTLVRLRSGQPTQLEYRLVRPDGSSRRVRETVQVSGGGGGRNLRLDGVVTDLTECR
jgi:PAS domain-containing protein